MTTNNPTSPREELARIIDPSAFDKTKTGDWVWGNVEPRQQDAYAKADEWLSRPPVKAASPEGAVAFWEALKRRCASTKPGTPEWDDVTTLVQVRLTDVEAALLSTPPASERAEVVADTDDMVERAALALQRVRWERLKAIFDTKGASLETDSSGMRDDARAALTAAFQEKSSDR